MGVQRVLFDVDDGVVVDPPPTNRWALAGLVVAGLAAGGALFTMPWLRALGVPFGPALEAIAAVEAGAALTCVYCLLNLHPEDAEVERY